MARPKKSKKEIRIDENFYLPADSLFFDLTNRVYNRK